MRRFYAPKDACSGCNGQEICEVTSSAVEFVEDMAFQAGTLITRAQVTCDGGDVAVASNFYNAESCYADVTGPEIDDPELQAMADQAIAPLLNGNLRRNTLQPE